MAKFGRRSLKVLGQLHDDAQIIMLEVIHEFDCTLLEGFRPKEKQDYYFEIGLSKIQFPNGKHNVMPSFAWHAMPWHPGKPHVDWNHVRSMMHLAGYIRGIGDLLYSQGKVAHRVRWGGDWDRDFDVREKQWDDLAHYELYKP